MTMRPVDVLTNLKNHDFDTSNYPLRKAESDVCMDAIKKRTPKMPEMMADGDFYFCPVCKSGVNRQHNFCYWCGQALRWGNGVE